MATQKLLIVVGTILVALGLFWPLLSRLDLGHLRGDFIYRSDYISVYFPLATSIVVSLVLTLVLWLLNR